MRKSRTILGSGSSNPTNVGAAESLGLQDAARLRVCGEGFRVQG